MNVKQLKEKLNAYDEDLQIWVVYRLPDQALVQSEVIDFMEHSDSLEIILEDDRQDYDEDYSHGNYGGTD